MSHTLLPIAPKPDKSSRRYPWNDFILACATVALMFALRAALTPLVGTHYPFATFFFGIVFISMRYGLTPALIALLISFPLSVAVFGGNITVLPHSVDEAIGNIFILLNSGTIMLMAQRQRRIYVELAEKEETTRRHVEALEKETQARRAVEHERERYLGQLEDANLRLRRAMQETHHRVKNNLQVVSALVDMHEDPNFPPAALTALTRIGQHIRTLATVHDVLTLQAKSDSEVNEVPVQSIVSRLLELMATTLEGRQLQCDVEELSLPAQQAASLALLINELVNNAIKHGNGNITVSLCYSKGEAHLEVCDDGPGFPPDFDSRSAAHTGMELIDSMGRWDLRGAVVYGNRPQGGARVQVTFPLPASTTDRSPSSRPDHGVTMPT
jgi:two-component sensor histidine kinase